MKCLTANAPSSEESSSFVFTAAMSWPQRFTVADARISRRLIRSVFTGAQCVMAFADYAAIRAEKRAQQTTADRVQINGRPIRNNGENKDRRVLCVQHTACR